MKGRNTFNQPVDPAKKGSQISSLNSSHGSQHRAVSYHLGNEAQREPPPLPDQSYIRGVISHGTRDHYLL